MTTTLPEGPEALLHGTYRVYFCHAGREYCAACDCEFDYATRADFEWGRASAAMCDGNIEVVDTDADHGEPVSLTFDALMAKFGTDLAHKIARDIEERAEEDW